MQPLDSKLTFRSALDRMIRASIGRMTMGISPVALAQAYQDWALHLAMSPGMQLELVRKTVRKLAQLAVYSQRAALHPRPNLMFSPCPRITGSRNRNGGSGLSIFITNLFCWGSSGGIPPPPPCAVPRSSIKMSPGSSPNSCWT